MITVGETYLSSLYYVRDDDGTLANADVSIELVLPDGSTDTASAIVEATGTYAFNYTTSQAGRHVFSVTATGQFLGATVLELGGDVFNVDDASTTAVQLVGLAEAKEHLNIPESVSTHDEELRAVIVSASRLVEAETQLWHRETVTQTLNPARVLYLTSRPVSSVTSVTQDGVTLSGYELGPGDALIAESGLAACPPWSGTGVVTVVYEAGETVVPAAVRQATNLTIGEIWRAQRAPSALPLAGRSGYEDADAVPSAAYALPFGAQKLLEPWVRGPLMA